MKRLLPLLFSFFISGNIHAQFHQQTYPIDVMLQKISQVKDTVIVLGFWSVWFDDSKQSLNDYENFNLSNDGKNVRLIFCNLDFNYNQDTLVKPFLLGQNYKSKLWHVAETDPDKWKIKIDEAWTGGFPAEVAYYNGKKIYFHEGVPDMEGLKQAVAAYLK